MRRRGEQPARPCVRRAKEPVRLAGRGQITAVVVDGRLWLWHGRPADWDAAALVRRAAAAGPRVVRSAGVHRVDPDPDGLRAAPRRSPS